MGAQGKDPHKLAQVGRTYFKFQTSLIEKSSEDHLFLILLLRAALLSSQIGVYSSSYTQTNMVTSLKSYFWQRNMMGLGWVR